MESTLTLRISNLVFRFLTIFGVVALSMACGGGGSGVGTSNPAPKPPVISTFTVFPPTIASAQDVSLRWSVTGATELQIDPGAIKVTGTNTTFHATATATYTLTATNADGKDTAQATVTLTPPGSKPVITAFSASPATITAAPQSVLLSWTVSGADSLSIAPGIGTVTGTSLSVNVPGTATYTLTATNTNGDTTASTKVTHAPAGTVTITGSIINGNTVTISGSGFGNTGPNIVFFEDFEKGSNGALIATAPATVGTWNRGNLGGYASYNTSWAHSGSKCMKNDWDVPVGEPNNISEAPKISFSDTDNLFYSFWTMVPAGKNVPGDDRPIDDGGGGNPNKPNWKLSWVNYGPNEYISTMVLDCDLTWGYWFCFDGGDRVGNYEGNHQMAKGRWSRFDFYQRSSRTAGAITGNELDSANGLVNHVNKNNIRTTPNGGAVWNYLLIPGYGRGKTTNGVTVYDDIYIATGPGARARVEIGDNPTYADCHNLAICTATSWSDKNIQATIRQGSFLHGDQAYLFIIDANSNVSNGYPMTIPLL